MDRFTGGNIAREKWAKKIDYANEFMTVSDFNLLTENKFVKAADIVLDYSENKQTTLCVSSFQKNIWEKKQECVYIISRNNNIMKIGGTRTGMKERWNSYLCGFCVPERKKRNGDNFPGKMSVTNAYLYHTIEDDILNNGSHWEFYCWVLPPKIFTENILGKEVAIMAQTYQAYESICIDKFKEKMGLIPVLCNNSDPEYK